MVGKVRVPEGILVKSVLYDSEAWVLNGRGKGKNESECGSKSRM